VAPADASSNLARYDGVKVRYRAPGVHDITELYEKSRGEGFGAEVQRRILIGTFCAVGWLLRRLLCQSPEAAQALIKRDFEQAFEKCDVLLTPTTPGPAFGVGAKTTDPLRLSSGRFHVTVTWRACRASRCRPADPERPAAGPQLIGKAFDEATCCAAPTRWNRPPISGIPRPNGGPYERANEKQTAQG